LQHQPTARGPYALQAAIASLQAETPIDWPQIAALYGELADRTGSDVVRLNRAVAIAEADGPAAALAIVDALAPDSQALIGFRLVQGAGAAVLVPQVFSIIQLNFTGPARARRCPRTRRCSPRAR
jgi:predicted RNA polymerase sigma factor